MDYERIVLSIIEYIEENLFDKNLYKEVLKRVYISKFHFHRIFLALTNETIGDYIRKRRFTVIGKRLKITEDKIIDIALDAGYQSHESFTRAFKKYFACSPNEYRNHVGENDLLMLAPFTENKLELIRINENFMPEIIYYKSLELKGFYGKTSLYNLNIEKYWNMLHEYCHKKNIVPSGEYMYTIWLSSNCDVRTIDPYALESFYIGGVFVEEAHEMKPIEIGNQLYAVFSLHSNFEYIKDLYRFIYFTWLKKSGWILDNHNIFEGYSKDFSLKKNTGHMKIFLPIKKQ
ncbi:helix-turn-helix domain-containing protein [Brassicibacter mesophilus]|uniref:helix-turn-helix domain-containing protein n=1 Tax=Brassicibacter mesophilus TaxID=745119 RepID=UPI003D238C5D